MPARFWAAQAMRYIGDLEGDGENQAYFLDAAERLGDRYWLVSALWRSETASFLQGDWQAARGFSDRGLSIFNAEYRLISNRVALEYETGEYEAGAVYVQILLELTRSNAEQPSTGFGLAPAVFALVAEITGTTEYLEMVQTIAKTIIASPFSTPNVILNARIGLALLASLQSDWSIAAEQYSAIDSVRRQQGIRVATSPHAIIDRVLGRLSHTMDHFDQASEHFEDSLTFCRKAGYRPELAWTCCDYADMLRKRDAEGDRPKAIALLEESLAISSELGMRPLMERVLSLRGIMWA